MKDPEEAKRIISGVKEPVPPWEELGSWQSAARKLIEQGKTGGEEFQSLIKWYGRPALEKIWKEYRRTKNDSKD